MARLEKYYREVPETEKLLDVMNSHFENSRFNEMWALRDYWTAEYQRCKRLKPKTLKQIELHKCISEQLRDVMIALQNKYDELHEKIPPYKEYDGVTYTDPYLFLEFIEHHLNKYGKQFENPNNDKKMLNTFMNSLVYDLHSFFNVWAYDDLFTIDDENIRLKIAELLRLSMNYQGVELVKERKEVQRGKSLESLL